MLSSAHATSPSGSKAAAWTLRGIGAAMAAGVLALAGAARGQCLAYGVGPGPATFIPGVDDIGLHVDDGVLAITLPFNVNFYGQSFGSVTVSTNGNLQFASGSNSYINNCLPTTTFGGPTIFPFWDDLYTTATAAGEGIFTTTDGVAPNRKFVIEWRTVYCCTGGTPIHSFEVIFTEGQDSFDVVYGTPMTDRLSVTIGCQENGAAGSAFTQYVCNGAPAGVAASTGLSLRFTCLSPATAGACCSSAGVCNINSQAACTGGGAFFFGVGTTCSLATCPVGACCNGAACTAVISNACSPGTFFASGSCAAGFLTPVQRSDALEDISANSANPGTAFVLGGGGLDDGYQLNIPIGFTFNFYGSAQTEINICTNGTTYFGAGAYTGYPTGLIPSATNPTNAIAPYWRDLVAPTAGNITYATRGTAPYRRFIVQWDQMALFAVGGASVTVQEILYETADAVAFRYGTLNTAGGASQLAVGLENQGATASTSVDPSLIAAGNTALVFQAGTNPCSGGTGSTGSCCSAGCQTVSYGQCLASGGAFQGNGTTCASAPCVNGACCSETGNCTLEVQSICLGNGGTYQGDGIACGVTPCSAVGSCCTGTSCARIFPANCTGTFTASGTCNPNPCAGSCCEAGVCSLVTNAGACASGTFGGAGSTCAGANPCQGACCNADSGACALSGATGCPAGTTFFQQGTTCTVNPCPQPPTGACCIATTQTCSDLSAFACNAAGGNFLGTTTACATAACPFGACCQGSCGGCAIMVASACTAGGGAYRGDGAACDAAANCTVINGGFESGAFAPGWTQFGNLAFTAVNAGAWVGVSSHGGAFEAHFGPTITTGGIQQTIPAHTGDTVTIGFWYQCNLGVPSFFSADFDGQTLVTFTDDAAHAGAWTQFTFMRTASADNPVLSFTTLHNPSYLYLDDITVCITPAGGGNTGACCSGATCVVAVQADCAGPNARFTAAGTACNALGNNTTPCCRGDFNQSGAKTVQDLFDYLAAWFLRNTQADTNGNPPCTGAACGAAVTVQDLFDFLAAWFGGCGGGGPTGSCCNAAGCTITDQAGCSLTWTSGGSCTPNPCAPPATGACCSGATCLVVANAAACSALNPPGGANTRFTAAGQACNALGNNLTPCCKADFNQSGAKSVQDLFDFLAAWFARTAQSDINGNPPCTGAACQAAVTVQDLFDFLAVWFPGC